MFAAAVRRLATRCGGRPRRQPLPFGLDPAGHRRRRGGGYPKARDEGVGRQIPDEAIPRAVAAAMWQLDYVPEDPA